MRAGKHQREATVGNLGLARSSFESLGHDFQLLGSNLVPLTAADTVDHFSASDRQQPRFGIRRTAVHGPIRKRGRERLGERVLGRSHIARPRREIGDEFAVAATRDRVGGDLRLFMRFVRPHSLIIWLLFHGTHLGFMNSLMSLVSMVPSINGRTSTTPCNAVGERAAHESAASRSGTSMM